MKVGLLVTNSRSYPGMMFEFMEGLNTRFKSTGVEPPQFLIEPIIHGGDHQLIQQKAEGLLLHPEVKILIIFADPISIKKIEPIVNASGKILISADAGAQIPGYAIPMYQHLSLSLQSSYGIALAVLDQIKEKKKKFAYITSFYDAGYSHVYGAFRMWEKNGGELNYNLVIPMKPPQDILDPMSENFNQNPPDSIVLQFCDEGWSDFYSFYRNKHMLSDVPVCASSFLFERNWAEKQPYYFEKAKGYVSWDLFLNNSQNNSFTKKIKEINSKNASLFHLLGWDIGSLLIITLETSIHKSSAVEIVQQVTAKEMESPRGTLIWNPKFRQYVSPMYEIELQNKNGYCSPVLTGKTVNDSTLWEEFAGDFPPRFTQWLNSYPCPT